MKFWLSRVLVFFAVSLVWLSRLLGVYVRQHDEVLNSTGDLKELQDFLQDHTTDLVKGLIINIKARMPWNK